MSPTSAKPDRPPVDEKGLLPGLLPIPEGGRRIAVVDLLFGWPPHGGAPRDLYEVFRHLAKTHHVRFILPAVHDVITRGRIDKQLPFEVQLVRMTPDQYRDGPGGVGEILRRAVDEFAPDAVFVGDGWAMKPVVVAALADYRPVVRFYAYEAACFRGAGELFRDGAVCERSWLKTLDKADHRFCIQCCIDFFAKDNPREPFFWKELVQAGAFEPDYPSRVAETLGKASALVCYNTIMGGIIGRHNPNTRPTPSGVELSGFTPLPAEAVKPGQILFAGRVYDKKKGFDWVIQACDALASRGGEFRLLTTGVGRPTERDWLTNVGWINQDGKLAALMAESAINLVPSLWPEALGMVTLEAMACGRPVVAARTGGLGEIFTHGREGLYVTPGDVEGLADNLHYLLTRPEEGHAMGARGRLLVEEKYDWGRIAEERILPLLFPNG